MAQLAHLLVLAWLSVFAAARPAVSRRAAIAYQNITPQQWQDFNNTVLKGSLRVGVPMVRPHLLHPERVTEAESEIQGSAVQAPCSSRRRRHV